MSKGSVRSREKCPVCGGSFTLQIVGTDADLYCEKGCRTKPKYYFVDARMFKRKVPRGTKPPPRPVGIITEDDKGRRLDSYPRTADVLATIRADWNKNPYEFNSSKYSNYGKRSRKIREVWSDWEAHVWKRFQTEKNNLDGYYDSIGVSGKLHILPVIGDVLLGRGDNMELTPGILSNLNFTLSEKGLMFGTRKRIFSHIRAMLGHARREKIIGTDDLPEFPKFPKRENDKRTVYTTTRDVQDQIRAYMPDGTKPLCDVLAETGMRLNEGCALQKVDLEPDGRIHIQRGISNKRRLGPPKNGKRKVAISPDLYRQLMAIPVINESFLFQTEKGLPYTPHTFGQLFNLAKVKAGYPQLRPYSCYRHSKASEIYREGNKKLVAAAAAGIGDIPQTAADHYIHGEETLVVPIKKEG